MKLEHIARIILEASPDQAPKFIKPVPDSPVDIKPTRISQAIRAANRRNNTLNRKTDPDNSGVPVPNPGNRDPVNEGQHSLTGIDGKTNVMEPGKQGKKVQPAKSPIKNQIDPTQPPKNLIGNSSKTDYMNSAKRKMEQQANEDASVPIGTKERRKLNYVGRMKANLPNKTLGREAAYKTNVIDEERVLTIKKVLKEKEPNVKDDAKENKEKMKTKVVIPRAGATPTIYNPPLSKKDIAGSINQ